MRAWLVTIVVTLSLNGGATAQVVINELMARNAFTLEDPDEPGQFEDWIELYNAGTVAVDLGGMYLTDDLGNPTRWRIPEGVSIEPAAYLLIWADSDDEQGATHTSFRLGAGGEAVGLFAADGVTVVDSVTFGQQEADVSFGRFPDAGEKWCLMGEPTPGVSNNACRSGEARFSRRGGTFVDAFELELTTESPNAGIFYTLDRREPSDSVGTLYTGPITISTTTWVRARVYEADSMPGPIVSEAYLALEGELEGFNSSLPLVVIDSFGRPVSRDTVFQPVSAVFIDTDQETGRATITDDAGFAGHMGMRLRGQSTQSYPKKQFRMEVWDEYDEDREVPLLGMPEESDWILHAPYSDKTLMRNYQIYAWSRDIGRYAVRSRFVETFLDSDRNGKVGMDDYVGVYVLMESIKRDSERVNIRRLDPGDNSEPEISGGYLLRKGRRDGDGFFITQIYRDELIFQDPEVQDLTTEQQDWIEAHFDEFEEVLSGDNFADPIEGYAKYIDVDSFIDHHMLVELSRNVDGFVLSTFLYKDRNGKINMGPIWDYNGSLGGANYFCSCQVEGWQHEFVERDCPECREGSVTFQSFAGNTYRWYERLWEDPKFLKRYAERWVEHRQGPFSTENMMQDIDRNVMVLTDNGAPDNPMTRNFQRWPVLNRYIWPNFLVRGTYTEHVDWMKEWLTARLAWLDEAVASVSTLPPEFSHPSGTVPHGFEVTLTVEEEGDIYYTLNGPDPKTEENEVAPEADLYSGPIVINENTRIRARALTTEGFWSAMVSEVYATDIPTLAFTEIMYDPPQFPGDEHRTTRYEFFELHNFGDEPVDLTGARLLKGTGRSLRTRFDFSTEGFTSLGPGEYVVLVSSEEAFRERYGDKPTVAGTFSGGSLSNSGDQFRLLGPLEETFMDFDYDGSWYPSAAAEVGHSLVLDDATAPSDAWSRAEAWRPSHEVGGSPGAEDVPPPEGRQLRGDFTGDGRLGISDAVAIFRWLLEGEGVLPCASEASNTSVLDVTGEGFVNAADGYHIMFYLFLGGPPRNLSPDCQLLRHCPDVCGTAE